MNTDKLRYYSQQFFSNLLPKQIYQQRLLNELENIKLYTHSEIEQRVNYYLKPQAFLELDKACTSHLNQFKLKNNSSAYYYDLLSCLRYFPAHLKFSYLFGDVIHVPDQPTFVKSRPISNDNHNSVLFKLNSVRHFKFVHDPFRFRDKKDIAIFRGACHQSKRKEFLKACFATPNTDIGDTRKQAKGQTVYKAPISIREHMKNKFIISVEGNDVASNLKWILNSNSLCFMTRPKYETWFMEGTLIPNYHYVLLKDDYSDLAEKIDFYRQNDTDAQQIISNAKQFSAQFQDLKKEKLISLLVMQNYLLAGNPTYRYAAEIKRPEKQIRADLKPSLVTLTD